MPNNLVTKLQNIGNAIRSKTGGTTALSLDAMPSEIASISGDAYIDTLNAINSAINKSTTTEVALDFTYPALPTFNPEPYRDNVYARVKITSVNLPNLQIIRDASCAKIHSNS